MRRIHTSPFHKFVGRGALALVLLGLIAGLLWYHHDRASLLSKLCKAGLPNFSRPSVVNKEALGCAILGPKQRVTGLLATGFEVASFESEDLGPPLARGDTTAATWYSHNHTLPRNDAVDRQLDQRIPGVCVGMAELVVEGWPTVTPGRYGHMGRYTREFFEDRVLEVRPPPRERVEQIRALYAKAGLTDFCSRMRSK